MLLSLFTSGCGASKNADSEKMAQLQIENNNLLLENDIFRKQLQQLTETQRRVLYSNNIVMVDWIMQCNELGLTNSYLMFCRFSVDEVNAAKGLMGMGYGRVSIAYTSMLGAFVMVNLALVMFIVFCVLKIAGILYRKYLGAEAGFFMYGNSEFYRAKINADLKSLESEFHIKQEEMKLKQEALSNQALEKNQKILIENNKLQKNNDELLTILGKKEEALSNLEIEISDKLELLKFAESNLTALIRRIGIPVFDEVNSNKISKEQAIANTLHKGFLKK
jgi:hypothetical protein